MIGRRGILGLIAGAPAAAKAAASGIGPAPDAFGYGGMDSIGWSNMSAGQRVVSERDWAPQRIAELAKQLAGLRDRRAEKIAERVREVGRLDPDLSVNRSMSLATKMRLQAERDVDRALAQEGGWLTRELAELRQRFPFL